MSAKSLGVFPVIYAIDEVQNSLLRTTMLFEGGRNSTGGRNGVFTHFASFQLLQCLPKVLEYFL